MHRGGEGETERVLPSTSQTSFCLPNRTQIRNLGRRTRGPRKRHAIPSSASDGGGGGGGGGGGPPPSMSILFRVFLPPTMMMMMMIELHDYSAQIDAVDERGLDGKRKTAVGFSVAVKSPVGDGIPPHQLPARLKVVELSCLVPACHMLSNPPVLCPWCPSPSATCSTASTRSRAQSQ
ncbi:hypothetical protein NL676_005999 [Syzygium grande]|nr:hypothetical protein NL676_005999 [Syzygium grande]